MIRFCLLGSGSKGNAIFIASERIRILIDNGLSFRQLKERLRTVGESVDNLSALFVTHEHSDHVQGIGTLVRNVPMPVFVTRGTADAIYRAHGNLSNVELFEAGDRIPVADLEITSFSVSHDAVDPVNYVVSSNGTKLGVAADLGYASKLVFSRLQGAHALLLEANHCPDLLMKSKYPPYVKQRILSKSGHMSNREMRDFLAQLLHRDLKLVVLVHLSEENNRPELALQSALDVLSHTSIPVHVATQHAPTPMFEIKP